MKRILPILLCFVLCLSFLAVPVSADFQVTYYNEEIYAGGILDLKAFVGDENLKDYSFRWQFAGVGSDSWVDLEENANYKGTKTNHLQVFTKAGGDYEDWDEIPFRCLVTKGGVSKATPNIHMHILPYDSMLKAMKNKGIGLFEPSLTNVTGLSSKDDLNYTATAYAGSNIQILCGGSTESSMTLLQNSDVQLKREIKITENGKYTVTGDQTSYIPYTVGNNAVKIEVNMRIIMAGADRGIYQTKTIHLTTKKPDITATGKAKSACSLLRYTYNESEKLAFISKGTNLEIIGEEGSYYQVYYNGFIGYIGTSLVDADVNDSRIIEHVDLSIAVPQAGNVWPSSVTVKPDSCFATYVEWYDKTDAHYLSSGERFIKGHNYQLVIWVSAKEGYQFKLDSNNQMLTTAMINGSLPCFTSRAYEQIIGKVIDIRYDFNNVQEGTAPPTQPTNPSTQPQHTHTPSDWRTTGAYHYKACTTCGDFLEQDDHKGGVATCTEKGKCTVCGYAYLETNENHTPDAKWTACGSLYHAKLCKLCGTHCDPQDHVPGPEATETAPQICTVCQFVITPAKNHVHRIKKVEANEPTCTRTGNSAYYMCEDCRNLFADQEGKTPLTESVLLPAAGHSMVDGKCTVCGYAEGAQSPTEEPTKIPTQTPTENPTEAPTAPTGISQAKPRKISWLTVLLLALVCFAAAVTVTVIVLKKKNRH